MLAVHSGHRSTSEITDQTVDAGAAMSTAMLKWVLLMAGIEKLRVLILREFLMKLASHKRVRQWTKRSISVHRGKLS
jgi:hypothetical protein